MNVDEKVNATSTCVKSTIPSSLTDGALTARVRPVPLIATAVPKRAPSCAGFENNVCFNTHWVSHFFFALVQVVAELLEEDTS